MPSTRKDFEAYLDDNLGMQDPDELKERYAYLLARDCSNTKFHSAIYNKRLGRLIRKFDPILFDTEYQTFKRKQNAN